MTQYTLHGTTPSWKGYTMLRSMNSPDGRGAWVVTYEDGVNCYTERFYFEDAAREYVRVLPDNYTHVFIELGQHD